ncbi:MAG: sulfotransferase domain-containing protein [Chloroflexota bacterium]
MLVDFMMIGAQKSGTTNLGAQLATHPDICFCDIKEPAFFNETVNWQAGIEEYHQLYAPTEGQLCGEASTMYSFLPEHPGTHERLFEYNPDLKLIYIMRHPVNRIVSHYAHNFVRSIVKDAPDNAVFADPTYINRSRYGVQIRPYLELFGHENVLLLIFEEYIAEPDMTLQQVSDFLQIDAAKFSSVDESAKHQSTGRTYLKYEAVRQFASSTLFQSARRFIPDAVRHPIRNRLSNQIEEKPEFSPELKRLIWRFVEDDVYEIETIIDRKLPIWREGYIQ